MARAAHSSERAAYALADALVGRDGPAALGLYLRLRGQGESLTGLIYRMAQRLRDALDASLRLQAGDSAADIRGSLRMPQKAAERFMADLARTDPDRLLLGAGPARGAGTGITRRIAASQQANRRGRWISGDARRAGDRGRYELEPARTRAARDFLRAPVLRCRAPRLTALSIVLTSSRWSSSAAAASSPP